MRSHRLDTVAQAPVMDHLIRRECARSDRTGQQFSLVVFRIENIGKRRRARSAHRLARVMLKRARLSDDVGWIGDEHLAALLPDTAPVGAKAFSDGVRRAVSRHELEPQAMVYTYPRDGASVSDALNLNVPAARENLRTVASQRPESSNGRSKANGHDKYGGLRINGHAVFNGGANGHEGLTIRGNGRNGSAVAVLENSPALRSALRPAPVVHERIEPQEQLKQVAAVEELLAMPMPLWKRISDIISSIILMIVFSPIFAAAAVAIKLSSPGPVIYRQRRSGLGGKPFMIYKFRTMIVGAEKQQQELRKFNEQDGPAFKLTCDPRVTRVGKFLRKTSIDELPQLWNILRGEMSLVGPRPLPIAEQEGCERWQRHRLNVTPGITCIWQVKGRSQVTFAEWVRMDVEYIRRRTVMHDLIILFSTIPSVLLRRGAR